jgi:hypothetical protein
MAAGHARSQPLLGCLPQLLVPWTAPCQRCEQRPWIITPRRLLPAGPLSLVPPNKGYPRRSPITGAAELHYPALRRAGRVALSAVATAMLLAAAAVLLACLLSLQVRRTPGEGGKGGEGRTQQCATSKQAPPTTQARAKRAPFSGQCRTWNQPPQRVWCTSPPSIPWQGAVEARHAWLRVPWLASLSAPGGPFAPGRPTPLALAPTAARVVAAWAFTTFVFGPAVWHLTVFENWHAAADQQSSLQVKRYAIQVGEPASPA